MELLIMQFLNAMKIRNDNEACRDVIFFMQINGGYECWLQLELANFFRRHNFDIFREVTRINEIGINFGGKRVDIVLKNNTIPPEFALIEIKCQPINKECCEVALGFWKDVLKLNSVSCGTNTIKCAIAFVYFSDYQTVENIIGIFNYEKQLILTSGHDNHSSYETGKRLDANDISMLQQKNISFKNINQIRFEYSTENCRGMIAVLLTI